MGQLSKNVFSKQCQKHLKFQVHKRQLPVCGKKSQNRHTETVFLTDPAQNGYLFSFGLHQSVLLVHPAVSEDVEGFFYPIYLNVLAEVDSFW